MIKYLFDKIMFIRKLPSLKNCVFIKVINTQLRKFSVFIKSETYILY